MSCYFTIDAQIRHGQAIGGWLLIFVLLCFGVGAIGSVCEAQEKVSTKTPWSGKVIRVQLHDKPGIQFLGIFVAKELGLFTKGGLPEVEVSWNTHFQHATDFLVDHQAEIATGWMSEGVYARAHGKPVVAITAVSQHSSGCVLVRNDVIGKSKANLSDLNGKKLGIWFCHEVPPKVFMALNNIRPDYIVHHSHSNILFAERAVAGMFSTVYSVSFMTKYTSFRDQVQVFRFSENNYDVPENVIFCSEQFFRDQPEVCRKFIKAMFLGWYKVFENEEEALKIYSKYCRSANVLDDPFIARQQLAAWKTILDLASELEANGQCKKEKYERLVRGLAKSGEVDPKKIPAFEDFFWPVLDESTRKRLQASAKIPASTNKNNREGQHE